MTVADNILFDLPYIEERYKKDETDEFLKPIIVNGDAGRIKGMFPSAMYAQSSDHSSRWRHALLLQLPLRSYARDCHRLRPS